MNIFLSVDKVGRVGVDLYMSYRSWVEDLTPIGIEKATRRPVSLREAMIQTIASILILVNVN